MELVARYVANGYGIGLSVHTAGVVPHPLVRVLPLADFEPVEIAALWNGETTPLIRAVLVEAQRYVAQLWPDWAGRDQLV